MIVKLVIYYGSFLTVQITHLKYESILEYLNQKYTELINPINFIKLFGTTDEFIEWAQLGSTEDLLCTISEFEKAELYEYCGILRQVLDSFISRQQC